MGSSASVGPLRCTLRYELALLPKSFDRPGPKSMRPATYLGGRQNRLVKTNSWTHVAPLNQRSFEIGLSLKSTTANDANGKRKSSQGLRCSIFNEGASRFFKFQLDFDRYTPVMPPSLRRAFCQPSNKPVAYLTAASIDQKRLFALSSVPQPKRAIGNVWNTTSRSFGWAKIPRRNISRSAYACSPIFVAVYKVQWQVRSACPNVLFRENDSAFNGIHSAPIMDWPQYAMSSRWRAPANRQFEACSISKGW